MTIDKTIIEWHYKPEDFFESSIHRSFAEYDIDIQDGRAQVTLKSPTDPVPEDLKTSIQKKLEAIFTARQLCTHCIHTPLELEKMSIQQHRSDGSTASVAIVISESVRVSGHADTIATDGSGRILGDSKAERIAEQERYIDFIVNGDEKHQHVHALLKSYDAAVNDPADEFIHLFEIREALKKHFHGEQNAKKQLGISETKWTRFGELANKATPKN